VIAEGVEVGDLLVAFIGVFINRQKTFFGIEGEVAGIVVGEVIGAVAIADDEELDEAKQRLGVSIARVVLVLGTPLISRMTS